jgi:hypothetical protein
VTRIPNSPGGKSGADVRSLQNGQPFANDPIPKAGC